MTSPSEPRPTPGRWTLWHKKPHEPWHMAKALCTGTYEECHAEWGRLINEGWSGGKRHLSNGQADE